MDAIFFSAQYGPAQMRSFSIHHLSVATYNMIANNKEIHRRKHDKVC